MKITYEGTFGKIKKSLMKTSNTFKKNDTIKTEK